MTGQQMAFTEVLRFGLSPAPAGNRNKNSRLLAVEWRTSGGKLLGSIGTWVGTLELLEGMKKPATD